MKSTQAPYMKSSPIPWLVKPRDLRRYLYRAIRACQKGRVIFFYFPVRKNGPPELLALSPYQNWERILSVAGKSLREGRVRHVRLEDLPPLR